VDLVSVTGHLLPWVGQFALILVRISGLFLLSPIWGRANVPAALKVCLSALLSLILLGFFPPPEVFPHASLAAFLFACLGEILIGLTLGFVTTLFFSVVFTAGQIIDMQIGFGMVQVYDVQQNIQIPIAGSLLNLILLLCFLMAGGHMDLIRILHNTFSYIPLGHVQFTAALPAVIVGAFAESFVLAVRVAMPVIASGLLAEISLGVIVRTAPQMNVFVIGLPLKTIIGLVMLALIIPVFVGATGPLFDAMFRTLEEAFFAMAPA
jgi:flagellar biosynthetic protein FliR